MEDFQPDLVIHLAAQRNPALAERRIAETVSTNVVGSQIVLEAAGEAGVGTVIVASTGKAVRLFTGDTYAATKKLVEYQSEVMAKQYDMNISCTRFTHVVDNSIVGQNILRWIANDDPILLHSPFVQLPVQSALECYQLLMTAGVVAERGRPKVVALRDLGWPPIALLDLTLDYLADNPDSRAPIVFTGYPPATRPSAYPGTYDPLIGRRRQSPRELHRGHADDTDTGARRPGRPFRDDRWPFRLRSTRPSTQITEACEAKKMNDRVIGGLLHNASVAAPPALDGADRSRAGQTDPPLRAAARPSGRRPRPYPPTTRDLPEHRACRARVARISRGTPNECFSPSIPARREQRRYGRGFFCVQFVRPDGYERIDDHIDEIQQGVGGALVNRAKIGCYVHQTGVQANPVPPATLAAFERTLGKRFDIIHYFFAWGAPFGAALNPNVPTRELMISWNPSGADITDILKATYDGYIAQIRPSGQGLRSTCLHQVRRGDERQLEQLLGGGAGGTDSLGLRPGLAPDRGDFPGRQCRQREVRLVPHRGRLPRRRRQPPGRLLARVRSMSTSSGSTPTTGRSVGSPRGLVDGGPSTRCAPPGIRCGRPRPDDADLAVRDGLHRGSGRRPSRGNQGRLVLRHVPVHRLPAPRCQSSTSPATTPARAGLAHRHFGRHWRGGSEGGCRDHGRQAAELGAGGPVQRRPSRPASWRRSRTHRRPRSGRRAR